MRLVLTLTLAGFLGLFTGCWTTSAVSSNYRPGSTLKAAAGTPLVTVDAWLADDFSGIQAHVTRELVYGGRRLGKIALFYGEWSENYPRVPAAGRAEYELGGSDIIQFGDMRFQVISATEEEIEAKVLPPVDMHQAEPTALVPFLLPIGARSLR